MAEGTVPSTVERLKVQREGLAAAADALESAVTSASGDLAAWRDGVRAALDRVRVALAVHVEEVEAPGGLYADIAAGSPRLLPTVERLRDDHRSMDERVGRLDSLLATDDAAVDETRELALALLLEISRHRHRGADLLWEVYDVDIGGGG